MALCGKRHSFEVPAEPGAAAAALLAHPPPVKRARRAGWAAGGAGAGAAAAGAHAHAHAHAQSEALATQQQEQARRQARRQELVQLLRARFPGMDVKVVTDVLEACGDDVESAVAQLSSLELATNSRAQVGAADSGGRGAEREQQEASEQQCAALVASGGADDHIAGPSGRAETQALPDPSSQEWVDGLVSEMSAATDIGDAKRRAARVLQTYAMAVACRGGDVENAQLREQVDALARDNTILKRAVAIQNNRQQELAKTAAQVDELKRVVATQQEQLKQAEMSNYALSVHLRQATAGGGQNGEQPPDIF